MEDERRKDVWDRINNLGDRLARLEAMREGDDKGQAAMATQLIELTKAIHSLSLKMNTLETQRNTVIAAASIFGALITTVAHWLFRIMTGVRS